MIEYFLFLCIIGVFSTSYYLHFFAASDATIMIAYTGNEHPRLFEQQYQMETADLVVMHERPFRSLRLLFAPLSHLTQLFEDGHYHHLLVVHSLHPPVPLFYDSLHNIQYVHNNITIAELSHKSVSTQTFQLNI